MFAQSGRGPDTELGAALRADVVADRQDRIEVLELGLVRLLVRCSMCKFCTDCLRIQLALLEHVAKVMLSS